MTFLIDFWPFGANFDFTMTKNEPQLALKDWNLKFLWKISVIVPENKMKSGIISLFRLVVGFLGHLGPILTQNDSKLTNRI